MAYAVVINLDYENHSPEVCKELWGTIRERMCAAGFHCDGRTFTINLPEEQAAARARETMERLEEHLDYHRKHIYRY
nr:hypothetical protein [Gammaproteobacteria bacterium]NIU03338.1 hypothetical protein [Gammaproteobacteria bacterium]NIV50835.1 hypothetical protein [Gammaproteobacteria bacterium]NIV76131.1 hypothetical protein [Gammaproteobacteria bacterium]NIW86873.1 hypothetical protein [Gammaproteobacteria bacterium]